MRAGRCGPADDAVAIIDIGSNSIRLVMYDRARRTPIPIFNEKAVCALGQGLHRTGRLSAQGVALAHTALGRFIALARAMGVGEIVLLATAAVRDADDGLAFVREVEERLHVTVRVLDGSEEARLAAEGVLSAHRDADGLVADIGGGSLELVAVGKGELGDCATLPLGVLRLMEASGENREQAEDIAASRIKEVPWISAAKGKTLFAVGGAWRAIARIAITQTGHPLQVLDNFALPRTAAIGLIELIARQSRRSLEKVPGISKKRLPTLPYAATVLARVLREAQPKRLVFSSYGMREGQFFRMVPKALRAEDPVLAACAHLARDTMRFPGHDAELSAWTKPLFKDETEDERRLRHAACLLADSFWNEHPDYRAEQALLRVLRLPFLGLEHEDRATLARALFVRYDGAEGNPEAVLAERLLDETRRERALKIGLALRLGRVLSGGALGLLPRTRLKLDARTLILQLPANDAAFAEDVLERPMERLARAFGCTQISFWRK